MGGAPASKLFEAPKGGEIRLGCNFIFVQIEFHSDSSPGSLMHLRLRTLCGMLFQQIKNTPVLIIHWAIICTFFFVKPYIPLQTVPGL